MSVQIKHWMMTAWVPPWQRVISALSSPKSSSTVAHCWAARPTLLAALPCPSNWLRPPLQLSLDAGANRCPISTTSLAPNYRYQKMHHTEGHCFCTAWDQQGQLWHLSVPPSANPFQRMYLVTEGAAEAHTTLIPSLTLHCPSQFLCPPMPKSFFKTLHAELMKKSNCPPPQRTTCIFTLCCYDREDFIHCPALFPFSISHWVLNHNRLWEMLGP